MQKLTLGFIPLLDCATVVVARELGFAAAEGLDLHLVREISWANIRDRVIVGHYDAAHMLGPMVVASSLGIGHLTVPMVAPVALGLGGNAITAGVPLWQAMQEHGATTGASAAVQGAALRAVVKSRAVRGLPPLVFGMVHPFSCHNYELRYWLAASGIDPDIDVQLVVIPPPLLVDALRAGQVQGFCVGEPWNSLAVAAGAGHIVLPASAIWRLAPEKVLGCRADWAADHPQMLAGLVRAIHRAALWCDDPAHHETLASLLADPRHVGTPADVLRCGLSGRLMPGPGEDPVVVTDFLAFARESATRPRTGHALWFYSQMLRWRQVTGSPDQARSVRATWRPDLYDRALARDMPRSPPDEPLGGFFDGRTFDPETLSSG